MFYEFLENFRHNLFKPLLLFFYAGFLIPIFKVKLEFPKSVYQGLTIYLLLSIGWHGGEELAGLEPALLKQALGFMVIGFATNTIIGIAAYLILRSATRLRRVDAATVAGFYGSDSAGTFVTAVGVLTAAQIAYAPYMPVMLAVMEIPGCLVALYIVSQLRRHGMDANGNMPDEPNYDPSLKRVSLVVDHDGHAHQHRESSRRVPPENLAAPSAPSAVTGPSSQEIDRRERASADRKEALLALEEETSLPPDEIAAAKSRERWLNKETLHEVFMNPGIFLLFAGIAIGFVGRHQGDKVTATDDPLFVTLFHGMLCMFLLEMGITACSKLRDLGTAGWQFIAFALICPNLFATSGMMIAHAYSMWLGQPFAIGTYLLFGVLCGAASYIAVPAVQRLAIPEASPTLPLAASLGCTFSYNVTVGIPVYILIATLITKSMPIG